MTRFFDRFAAIDIETTGLDKSDAIIEIAIAFFDKGSCVDTWQTFVHPNRLIPQEITLLTGIDNAMVAQAPTWSEIEPTFLDKIEGWPLAAHNHVFDKGKIDSHTSIPISNMWLDSLEFAKLFLPTLTSYKLGAIASYLDISNESHHRALNDAVVCGQVLLAIFEQAKETDPFTLNEMATLFEEPTSLFPTEESKMADHIRDFSVGKSTPAPYLSDLDFFQDLPDEFDEPILRFDEAEDFFQPEGILSRYKDDFESRSSQVGLLSHIKEAIYSKKHGIFEAGTGTGKSFAYLVPALLWAYENEEPVIVSTNTINLQEQIFHKDLPFLSKALQFNFKVSLMKGRNNYLCKRRFDQQIQNPEKLNRAEKIFFASLHYWQRSDRSGDRERLNLNKLENQLWQNVACTADTCLNNRCPYFNDCYFFSNRRKCDNSHIIVVNHSLMLQNMRLDGSLLPDYKLIFIDEAHHLESEAIRQFTDTIDFESIRKRIQSMIRPKGLFERLTSQLDKIPDLVLDADDIRTMSETLIEDGKLLVANLADLIKKANTISDLALVGELRITKKIRQQSWWLDLQSDLEGINHHCLHYHNLLSRLLHRLEGVSEVETIARELFLNYDILLTQQNWLSRFVDGSDDKFVYWANSQSMGWGQNLLLHSATIDIMPVLKENFFSKIDTVILTSATLAVNNKLSYTAQNFLLEEDEYLAYIAPSPFNYEQQSCIAIPTDHPDYSRVNDTTFTHNIIQDLKELIPALQGGMLVLFTSYAMLNRVYFALKNDPALKDYPILAHGQDGSRSAIINSMKKNPDTIVLGANSFWEGIDVKGAHLRNVVITKLPFSPPTMPVESARSELMQARGKNAFAYYSLPNAILRFRQGCGRLIRSKSDWGSIIILDNRVITKPYGKQFLNSLPKQPILKDDMTGLCHRLSQWSENHIQS